MSSVGNASNNYNGFLCYADPNVLSRFVVISVPQRRIPFSKYNNEEKEEEDESSFIDEKSDYQ